MRPVALQWCGEQRWNQASVGHHHCGANPGNALVDSDVVALPDAEVLAYIRQGVAFDDPLNTTGQVMPPSGGRPDLRDEQLLAIIAHIRSLAP